MTVVFFQDKQPNSCNPRFIFLSKTDREEIEEKENEIERNFRFRFMIHVHHISSIGLDNIRCAVIGYQT